MAINELLAAVISENPPNICVDSRLIKAGDIFIALKGNTCDGHDFIDQAIANGARYIVAQQNHSRHRNQKYKIITVDNCAKAAAHLAQASRGSPASQLTNLAVTGTNGKTTVAFLV